MLLHIIIQNPQETKMEMEPPNLAEGFGEEKYTPREKRNPKSATRQDGSLKSQIGFLGPILNNDGGVMTDASSPTPALLYEKPSNSKGKNFV